MVNARHPAPVVHRIAVTHRLLNAMFGALHQAVPDRIPAAYYGNSYVCTFQTVAADAKREVLVEIEIGGPGRIRSRTASTRCLPACTTTATSRSR